MFKLSLKTKCAVGSKIVINLNVIILDCAEIPYFKLDISMYMFI